MSKTLEELRAAFEEDAKALGFNVEREQPLPVPEPWSEYIDHATGHRWGGYLAAQDALLELIDPAKQMASLIRLQRQHGGGLPSQDVDEFLSAFPER